MKSLLWIPLSCVLACEVTRPYGSFEPVVRDAGGPSGFDDDDAGDDDDDDDEAAAGPAPIPGRDGATRPTPAGMRDGGTGPGEEPDEPKPGNEPGPPAPPPNSPLAPYVGTYLMRMDMFSQVESKVLTTTLRVKNRVSNLLLAEVRVEGDRLISQETLCHQTYAHNCESGCADGWRTTPDAKLSAFLPRASTGRAYVVDGSMLRAEQAVIALGFDDDDVSSSTSVPTDLNDARLWKLEPSDPKRVGLRTRLQTQVSVARFDCVVSAVQLFATTFEGAVGEAASPLEGVSFNLATPPMPAASLAAEGEPSSYCNQKTLGEQASAGGKDGAQLVRFSKTGSRDTCPDVAMFEQALPAQAP